ncbi:NusA antitermination factor [Terriglobus roseus DSM 18391]|uniref:Transcription termination/antitermination protein NusA n=1 Tax=Terriglobus roseus (strain DSM 18391 / NRRL B-41598 / KBS 63) TaxID=926566 RepID=I3ZKG8_TERRK|nr:transcription termination factor NusA [Terriglobus roseus]AFL89736.1 NusA antitermination factor [Terriglobus roseus DSM 18391]
MASALYQAIETMSRDKGIDPEIVVGAVEDAIALATRKFYKTQENMRGEFDKESGEIRAYVFKTVVEDDAEIEDPENVLTLTDARELAPEVEVGAELRFYKDTSPLGRIAAQMAKQVIFQKVREAERDTVFNEYNHRVGEIINATVKRIEPMDVIFDLGKAEARMPKREQSRLEQFSVGERIRVALLRVDRAAKGPQVIVSRAAPSLVQTLFQSEVPEIYDGTVAIRAIAREAGERTKIAVVSRDKDVDPVGACVGMKGMRVQSIIRELRGEKIDIIEFSEEITTFAEKALQPAKVSRVSITDLGEKQLEVIVDDTQLSLAIGKKGQNVRLAAKLLGWKIDIKSEEEKRQEVEQAMSALGGGPSTAIEAVTELGEHVLEKLIAAGITTVEHLSDMTAEELGEVPGIGEKSVEKIAVAVRHYFGQYEEGEERPAVVSEAAAALGDNAASESSVSHDAPTEEDGKPYDPASEKGSEEGEVLLLAADQNEPGGVEGDLTEESSMSKTPEAIIAERGIDGVEPIEVEESADELLEREEAEGQFDGFGSDADVREAQIELDNQTMEDLADQAGEISNETIDPDENTRG